MSEDGIFSYQYVVSGFVFIALVFLVHLDLLPLNLLSNPATIYRSALLAILTFLLNPLIGFSITQLWFFLFNTLPIHRLFWQGVQRALIERHSIILDSKQPDQEQTYAGSKIGDAWKNKIDYWLYGQNADETGVSDRALKYLERRLHLFHSLSSIALSMVLGLAVGFGTRLVLTTYFHHLLQLNTLGADQSIFLTHYPRLLIVGSNVSVLVLIFNAWKSRNEHQNMIIHILQQDQVLLHSRTMKKYIIRLTYLPILLLFFGNVILEALFSVVSLDWLEIAFAFCGIILLIGGELVIGEIFGVETSFR